MNEREDHQAPNMDNKDLRALVESCKTRNFKTITIPCDVLLELMDGCCELQDKIARITNENARLKAELNRFIKVEPWVLSTTQDLAKGIARRCFPDVPQFEVLDDLAGVISQIDNMTTGMERKSQEQPRDYQTHIYTKRMEAGY